MTAQEKLAQFVYSRDAENKEFKQISDAIAIGHKMIVVNGKAGTGKSTYINDLSSFCVANDIDVRRVAFTGIAAKRIEGTTIHRQFNLRVGPYLPIEKELKLPEVDVERPKPKPDSPKPSFVPGTVISLAELSNMIGTPWNLKKIDLLVFDELSMLRCDTIDVCNIRMQQAHGNRLPFGGCIVLFFGDVVQLSAIVSASDQKVLAQYYKDPFSFRESDVFAHGEIFELELTKNYRQRNDQHFMTLLEAIRRDGLLPATIAELNNRVQEFNDWKNMDYSTQIICCDNAKAHYYNTQLLSEIALESYTFEANVEGDISDSEFSASRFLEVKVGSKVMVLRNKPSAGIVNGDMGMVVAVSDHEITVDVNGRSIPFRREEWVIEDYYFNKAEEKMHSVYRGKVTQFPLKLAWAITVHKAQGQPYEKVMCDLRDTFDPGHPYVALSRATSLEGITLLAPVSPLRNVARRSKGTGF